MSELSEEIRHVLKNAFRDGFWDIRNLPDGYPAQIFLEGNEFGVSIFTSNSADIDESFSEIRIKSSSCSRNGVPGTRISLISDYRQGIDVFSIVCADFVSPGENGEKREALLEDPLSWWEKWKKSIGNRNVDCQPYDVLGEVLSYLHLRESDPGMKWEGCSFSVVDIIGTNSDYEVKSTVDRTKLEITVSSKFQLEKRENPLYLVYCIFERSESGLSLEDVLNSVSSEDRAMLLENIRKRGQSGTQALTTKYRLVEMRVYPVDEKFPKITSESFKDNKIPAGIKSIQYVTDLSGLSYERIDAREISKHYSNDKKL